ncbi:hypothetical protein [Rhodoplanes roseus]|uniref:Uncharacterized protein n=1 Tax=Rhodoplanes roseus TaxID=29409 RepID=A0A327LBX3_9BRAD|nr:hypothetical protein [Rhodoplanes roseus]RAI45248.1 hypothetical protein CH341_04865 [Rhodoplanes roseus]
MIVSLLNASRCCSGGLPAMTTAEQIDAEAQAGALATAARERPFSIAPLTHSTTPRRCTANPHCIIADTCAATPAMRRACESAFKNWVQRGLAAAAVPTRASERR